MGWFILDITPHQIWLTSTLGGYWQAIMNKEKKICLKTLVLSWKGVNQETGINTEPMDVKTWEWILLDLTKQWCMFLHPWGLASDHRPSVQSVPLGLFYPESKAHDCLWLRRSGEGAWPLLSGLVVWFVRMCGWVVINLDLSWRNWGWVAHLTSVLWEGLRCSLLAPDSPSDSLTGWAVAQVPEICSARGWGTQIACLEPACGHRGPRLTHLLPWRGCEPCGMRLQLSP